MRKILTNLFAIIAIAVLLVFSCKKEENNYDWKKIEPGKQLISGPDSVKGNDSTIYEYLALSRGGSSYTWSVLYGPVTLKVDDENKDALHYHPYRVELKANSTVNDSAAIVVKETTWAGKEGITDTFYIKKVNCYQPFTVSAFSGEYSYYQKREEYNGNTSNEYTNLSTTISQEAGDIFVNENFYAVPGLKIKYKVSLDKKETISIVDTSYNITYEGFSDGFKIVGGTGTYSICDGTINLKYYMVDRTVKDTVYVVTERYRHK